MSCRAAAPSSGSSHKLSAPFLLTTQTIAFPSVVQRTGTKFLAPLGNSILRGGSPFGEGSSTEMMMLLGNSGASLYEAATNRLSGETAALELVLPTSCDGAPTPFSANGIFQIVTGSPVILR